MNILEIIYKMIKVFKWLVVSGAFFAIIFFLVLPNGKMVETGGPYWVIKDPNLMHDIDELLPKYPNVNFKEVKANIEIPMDFSFKAILSLLIVSTSGYFFLLLSISQRVIKEIRMGHAFSRENIQKVKHIGILIALSMFGEKLLVSIAAKWFDTAYSFEGMEVSIETHLGWYIVVVGAIIFALGVAFEQGLKLKEEQDLTI